MILKAIIIHIAMLAISLPGLSGNIFFNHLDNTQGLPQINVMSIYQDETGAMWFGTVEGISRYNGNAIQIFKSSSEFPRLSQNNIQTITGNKKGAIYIKADFDLIKYDIVEEKFRLLKESVNEIFYENETLWLASDYQIYTYTEGSDKISPYATVNENIGIISALCVSGNDIWVGGRSGLTVLKADSLHARKNNLPENISVNSIYIDREGLIWVGTNDKGIYIFDEEGNLIHHYFHIAGRNSLSNNQVRTIFEDNSGTVWIGTFFGLNSFNKNTKKWENYIHDDTRPHSLSHSSIFSIYEDEQGALWIGTYFGGVNYFNPKYDVFNFYNASSVGKNNLSFPFVGKMLEDQSGNLWICTEGGGLNCLNLETRKFTQYLYGGQDSDSAIRYNLKSIYYDETGNKLYIGIHNAGLCVFDLKTKSHKFVNQSGETENTLSGNSIRTIKRYKNSIILQMQGGLFGITIGEDEIKPFSEDKELNDLINSNSIYLFFIDSKDRLWLSTSGLTCIDLNTKEVKQYAYNENNPHAIGKFEVNSILETKNGELFFGTIGSGLFRYRPQTDDFESYTQENGKQFSNFCYHISEISEGYLLLLHNNAFTIFDPQNDNTLYRSSRNFPITGFFDGNSSYITRNKEIFIGGTNGLVSVQEAQLLNFSPVDYSLYFDKLYVNNKHVLPGDDSKILKKTLSLCDEINLRHNQNNLSIEFATSNYSKDAVLNYEYKLENFDENWNRALFNTIVYTNISPGEYKLLLREINSSKETDKNKLKSLIIKISPPFYKTKFAYILYLISLLTIITGVIHFFVWRYRINSALEIERKEKEQNEKLNQMKLIFFTNVSHELRTPLTLIIAQTESILSKNPEHKLKQKIAKVLNNAIHMRDLISELLDFRKQEQGYYTLKIERVNLADYIKDIYESFSEYAGKRNITYTYDFPEDENITAYIDKTQFKKAIYNLLSNAFKYTSAPGSITIRLRSNDYIYILIEDNGIGIPSDVLSKIFERFYQVEYRTSGFSLGTGIGLALTKEIVESHHGEIKVNSTLNEGSVFEIKLLKGYSHFNEAELKENSPAVISLPCQPEPCENNHKESGDNKETDSGDNTNSPYSILIVEDNEELLELLRDAFSDKYNVYTALNGKTGLEMATEFMPDIILSDIMMPEMSGKEMCYKIKNNINLSHIPVVMLTARDSTDQTIEGYMFGADDYVVKPFNMEILKARCNSIVKNRQLLHRNMAKDGGPVIAFDVKSEQEKIFMEKVTEIIKQNFDNPEFDINMLALELGMGRNKLYAKVKEITNLSPNEYALNLKMRESTHLLRDYLHLNISEIGIDLGFSSAKYFSKCFKHFYGITPVQWRKENATIKKKDNEDQYPTSTQQISDAD